MAQDFCFVSAIQLKTVSKIQGQEPKNWYVKVPKEEQTMTEVPARGG